MNKKITLLLIVFLLLIPLRLPIAVLLINVMTIVAEITGNLTKEILAKNIVVIKLVYDIVFSVLTVYNIEVVSRHVKKRLADEYPQVYWWSVMSGVLFIAYIVFDVINTYDLFHILHK